VKKERAPATAAYELKNSTARFATWRDKSRGRLRGVRIPSKSNFDIHESITLRALYLLVLAVGNG
jgi:hypothetical protein